MAEFSRLFFWNGIALFIGSLKDNSRHQHHAIQLCLALDEPFHLTLESESGAYSATLLASDIPHQFYGAYGRHILLLIEPESAPGAYLTNIFLAQAPMADLGTRIDPRQVNPAFSVSAKGQLNCDLAKQAYVQILSSLGFVKSTPLSMDGRIQKALKLMEEMETKILSAKLLAAELALSETRLIHLFKENIGIPMRPYLRWLRLIQAVKIILSGVSFTEAAHAAGFADSAHLSRTFRLMFGFAPSDIFKNDQFVQAIFCPA